MCFLSCSIFSTYRLLIVFLFILSFILAFSSFFFVPLFYSFTPIVFLAFPSFETHFVFFYFVLLFSFFLPAILHFYPNPHGLFSFFNFSPFLIISFVSNLIPTNCFVYTHYFTFVYLFYFPS